MRIRIRTLHRESEIEEERSVIEWTNVFGEKWRKFDSMRHDLDSTVVSEYTEDIYPQKFRNTSSALFNRKVKSATFSQWINKTSVWLTLYMLSLVNCILRTNYITRRENVLLVWYKSRCLPKMVFSSRWGLILPPSYFVSSLENRILEIEKRFYPPRRSSSCRVGGDWYRSTSVSSSANFAFIRLSVFLRRIRTAWGYYGEVESRSSVSPG